MTGNILLTKKDEVPDKNQRKLWEFEPTAAANGRRYDPHSYLRQQRAERVLAGAPDLSRRGTGRDVRAFRRCLDLLCEDDAAEGMLHGVFDDLLPRVCAIIPRPTIVALYLTKASWVTASGGTSR